MFKKEAERKITINKYFNNLTIHIPSVRSFQLFLLIFPFFIIYFFLPNFSVGLAKGNIFFIIPLLICLIIGGSALTVFLWYLIGVEKIETDKDYLSISKTIFGVGPKKKIKIDTISNITYEFSPNFNFWGEAKIQQIGYIVLYSKLNIIKFADDIDKKNAKKILENLENSKFLDKAIFSPFQ